MWEGLGATSDLVGPTNEDDKENLSSNSLIDEDDIFLQVTQSSDDNVTQRSGSGVASSRHSYQATTQDLHLEMFDSETQDIEG